MDHAARGADDVDVRLIRPLGFAQIRHFNERVDVGVFHVAVDVGGGMARLMLDAKFGRIGLDAAERDDLGVERAVHLALEGRHPATVRLGARRGRGRIGVGDVLGDDAHASGLGAQSRCRDRNRFQEIHKAFSRLALADGGLDEAQAARVERGRSLVVHLVGGDLDHLVFEIDGTARGAHLIAAEP